MSELFSRVQNHFRMNKQEIYSFFIATVIVAFIVGFDDKNPTFVFVDWIFNLFNTWILAIFSIFFAFAVQKIYALQKGYNTSFKLSKLGLLLGLLLSVFTLGRFWYILIVFTIGITHIVGLRLGEFTRGPNFKEMGTIAMMAPMSSIFLAVVFKLLSNLSNSYLLQLGIIFNIAFALSNILPIPPLNGHHLFYASRIRYIFLVAFIVSLGVLLLTLNIFWSILLAIIGAAIIGFLYFYYFEFN